jgi:hypothetical protein
MSGTSPAEVGGTVRDWRTGSFVFFGVLGLWPALWGWDVQHAAGAAAFLLGFVWLPGRALVAWTLRCASVLERALLSWAAGMALLGIVYVAGCMLDVRGVVWVLPPLAIAALLAARGREAQGAPLALPARHELLLLGLVLLLALLRSRPDLPGEWFLGFGSDDEFHAANAAELCRRWPLGDPRVAGEPLRYHFLSYSSSAAMSTVLGLPVRECMLGLSKHHTPLLFAFGVFVMVRALGASAWIAACGALALVWQMDLGELVQPLGGPGWNFNTPFYVGLYHSITNSAGLCLLLGLLLALHCVLARGAEWRRGMLLVFVLALAASATKSSVLPPLLAGLGLACVWKLVRDGGFDRLLWGSTAVIALGAAPPVLWLVSDSGGYAQSMFRLTPAHALRASALEVQLGALFGVADPGSSPIFSAAVLPLWIVLLFGPATIGIVYWILARGRANQPLEAPLAFTLLAGLVPSCLLASPGYSQLFFGYVSVVAAPLLGAIAAPSLFERRTPRARLLAGLGIAALGIYGAASCTWIFLRPRLPTVEHGALGEYRAALEWIRTSLPPQAVLLADDVRLSVDTWGERHMFLSTPRFTPRQRALWKPLPWSPDGPAVEPPYAPRERAQREFLAAPSAAGLARIRELLGTEAPLYALRSGARIEVHDRAYNVDVPPRSGPDALDALPGAERVFENASVAVYRLTR